MQRFIFLTLSIVVSFTTFSFNSIANESKVKTNEIEVESTLVNKIGFSAVALDSVLIDKFFKKYTKLKKYQNEVSDLYQKREYNSIWYDDAAINEYGILLYQKVSVLNEQGIKANMAYMNVIESAFDDKASNKLSKTEGELLLSSMYFFYSNNSGVDAETLKKIEWVLPSKNVSYDTVLDSLATNPVQINKDTNLLNTQYYKLQAMLKKYRDIEKNNLWKRIDIDTENYKDLKPFDSSVAVKQIRERLFVIGDLKQDSKRNVYDEEMMAGVLNYKKRYGLKLNYTLTLEHINQMNEPIENSIKTIMLNMERCRWIPAKLGQAAEYVMVNIPAYRLNYIKNGKNRLTSDVFVGSRLTETFIFSGNIDRIVFSPYWNVPASIVNNELKQKMAADENYLAENNMEWNDGAVRQKPGPKNSLGLVKFLFPNPNDIYLHDTPAKSLFDFEKRTFSHGCINIKDAKGLAVAMLEEDQEWSKSKIDESMSGEKETPCILKNKVPIFIGYFTAWVNENGEIGFYKDVYERDQRLDKLLFSDSVAMQ
ncbi:L,D-transpeptidase family protein [Flavobacterium sp. MR2016-29]|uniref:L,D-transpeptidase family protein n=1 Tax=Flavobacterium sp. MR2016-29 TaxID=2783795 RepID=UPI00188C7A4C|nr:L,D-transpeptidase family protein [Flavobacterium sp. MR2016-29]MBF4492160.1 L,D-transpeptidase family protein [Flavobacterium sp. MR2016-29]